MLESMNGRKDVDNVDGARQEALKKAGTEYFRKVLGRSLLQYLAEMYTYGGMQTLPLSLAQHACLLSNYMSAAWRLPA